MNRRSNVRPSLMRAGLPLMAGLALSGAARADALDECYRKALNNTEVVPCLEAARKHAEAEMTAANRRVVRDSAGNELADGDAVTLVKDLKVKGTSQTLKQGTVIRSIRLTDNEEEIDCRHDTIKGLVLRTEFVRKR